MIIGIGHDLCDIRRVEKVLSNYNNRFINRICTNNEIKFSKNIVNKINYFAMRFSVKEAFYKSLPIEVQPSSNWKDVELFKNHNGKPELVANEKILTSLNKHFDIEIKPIIHVSLSNEYPFVSSYVCISS